MATSENIRIAGKVAGWGAESGVIVTLAGVVPVLFLGTFVIEDLAAVAMLIAYGLLFGHYLARRLPAEGGVAADHAPRLRLAPPVAMCAGYLGMRLLMELSGATALAAIDGLVFGGLAGLVLGLALHRPVFAASAGAPGRSVLASAGILLGAGALMGLVAGIALSVPLGWTVAIPIWQAGMGAAIGFFLAPAPAST